MKKFIKPALGVIFLAGVVYLLKFSPFSYYLFDQAGRAAFIGKFEAYMASLGFWGPFIFIGFYVVCVAFFVPASVPSSIGGLIFGQWLGLGLNFTGAMIGAMVMFLMSRYLFRDMAVKLLSAGHFKKFDDRVASHGFTIIVYLRLMFVPFGYVNAAAGVSKISFKDFFWASLVSLPPGLAVITFLTGAIRTIMLAEHRRFTDFVRADIILPLLLFVFSFFVPAIINHFREKMGITKEEAVEE